MSDFSDGAGLVWDKAKRWAGYGLLAGFGLMALSGIALLFNPITAVAAIAAGGFGLFTNFGLMTIGQGLLTTTLIGAGLGAAKETLIDMSGDLQELKDNRKFDKEQNQSLRANQEAFAKFQASQQQAPAVQSEAGVPAQNVGAAQGQAVVAGK